MKDFSPFGDITVAKIFDVVEKNLLLTGRVHRYLRRRIVSGHLPAKPPRVGINKRRTTCGGILLLFVFPRMQAQSGNVSCNNASDDLIRNLNSVLINCKWPGQ